MIIRYGKGTDFVEGLLRCPDSCMLEKMSDSPPRARTASTISTYFLRLAESVDLSSSSQIQRLEGFVWPERVDLT